MEKLIALKVEKIYGRLIYRQKRKESRDYKRREMLSAWEKGLIRKVDSSR